MQTILMQFIHLYKLQYMHCYPTVDVTYALLEQFTAFTYFIWKQNSQVQGSCRKTEMK